MRKMLLSMLAATVLWGMASICHAQNAMKPVVTVSLAGYDRLMTDLDAIGRLGGNPDLGKGLEMMLRMMTQGKDLTDLVDAERPWGAVVLADDQQQFAVYGYIPTKNLKQLIELAKGNPLLAEAIRFNNGVWEIQAGVQAVYVRQKGPWAVIADKSENLAAAPADPLKLLGDLPEKYDLAVRVSIKNIPQQYREQALAMMRAGAEIGMTQQPGESDVLYIVRANLARQRVQRLTALINESNEVLLGWNIDSSAGVAHLDFELTAQSGTKLAEQFAQLKPGRTNFAGFLMPEAAVTANWARTLTDADVAQAKTVLAALSETILKELEKQGLSAEAVKLRRQWIAELSEVLEKTIEARKSDGGLAVLLDPTAVTVVAGSVVVDGAKLEKVLERSVDDLQQTDPDAAKTIKLNADSHQGVRFHTLFVPTPKEELKPLVGEKLEVVVGIADERVFLALGRDAAETLKKVIDRSQAAAGKQVPPVEIKLATWRIARFVAKVAKDEDVRERAAMLADVLEKAGAKDHVVITARPVPQGIRVRLEVEQGLLKALASQSRALAPMGGGF